MKDAYFETLTRKELYDETVSLAGVPTEDRFPQDSSWYWHHTVCMDTCFYTQMYYKDGRLISNPVAVPPNTILKIHDYSLRTADGIEYTIISFRAILKRIAILREWHDNLNVSDKYVIHISSVDRVFYDITKRLKGTDREYGFRFKISYNMFRFIQVDPKRYVVKTGDHGEMVFEKGVYGIGCKYREDW